MTTTNFLPYLLAGLLTFSLLGAPVHAQVDVNVGGGAYGSVETGDDQSTAEADAQVDVNERAETTLLEEEDDTVGEADTTTVTSDTSALLSLTRDQAARASIDAESAELDASAVTTDEDLSLYATSKMKRDQDIEQVQADAEEVELTYRRDARFLGFIPSSIRATARVTNDGEVEIDYPWYRFLFAISGSAELEESLEARLAGIEAAGDAGFSASARAEILEALHMALSGGVTAQASAQTAE